MNEATDHPEPTNQPRTVASQRTSDAPRGASAANDLPANPETQPSETPTLDVAEKVISQSTPAATASTPDHTVGAAPTDAQPVPVSEPAPAPDKKKWYVVKVQSGREESIRAAIERRVKIEGLEEYYGQIAIPVERYTELNKKNKPVVKERKKFHGYFLAQVEYNDKILSLFRDTSGVGDFVGGTLHRPPTPLTEAEVQKMLDTGEPKQSDSAKGDSKSTVIKPSQLPNLGEPVRIRDGTFANQVGQVKRIIEPKDANEPYKVEVEVSIFGRPVLIEIEYWQLEAI